MKHYAARSSFDIDHRHKPRRRTGISLRRVRQYLRRLWGLQHDNGEAPWTRFTYTGQEFDLETGLYFYDARYYDPDTGRFLAEDPLAFAGGDANLYRYAGNNPVTFVDPTGLSFSRPTESIASSAGFNLNPFGSGNSGFSETNYNPFGGSSFSSPSVSDSGLGLTPFSSSFSSSAFAAPTFDDASIVSSAGRFDISAPGLVRSERSISPDPSTIVRSRQQVGGNLRLGDYVRDLYAGINEGLTYRQNRTDSAFDAGRFEYQKRLNSLFAEFVGGTIDGLLPPSEPSTLVTYADGSTALRLSEGPSSGALLAQGAVIAPFFFPIGPAGGAAPSGSAGVNVVDDVVARELAFHRQIVARQQTASARIVNQRIESRTQIPAKIFRGGRSNKSAIQDLRVDKDGISFRAEVSNPIPTGGRAPAPVLRPGKPFIEVDTSKLPPNSVVPNHIPPGHVSVRGVEKADIVRAIIGGGKFPKIPKN